MLPATVSIPKLVARTALFTLTDRGLVSKIENNLMGGRLGGDTCSAVGTVEVSGDRRDTSDVVGSVVKADSSALPAVDSTFLEVFEEQPGHRS